MDIYFASLVLPFTPMLQYESGGWGVPGKEKLLEKWACSFLRSFAALRAARPPLAPDRWRKGAGTRLALAFFPVPVFRYLVVDWTPSLTARSVNTQTLLAFLACPCEIDKSDLSFSNA